MQDEYPTPPFPDATVPYLVVSVHRNGPVDSPHQTICVTLVDPKDTLSKLWKLWLTPQAAHQLADDLRWATGFYPVAEARALTDS